jgi:hypothetical protein
MGPFVFSVLNPNKPYFMYQAATPAHRDENRYVFGKGSLKQEPIRDEGLLSEENPHQIRNCVFTGHSICADILRLKVGYRIILTPLKLICIRRQTHAQRCPV